MELKDKFQDSSVPVVWENREANKFVINGETIHLSVQAGLNKWSIPKERGLRLKDYSHVKVLIFRPHETGMEIYYPSQFGFEGIDRYFDNEIGPFGIEVPIDKVQELADHLQKLSEGE